MGVFNTVRSGLNVLFTPVLYGVVASLAIQLATWEKGDRTHDKLQINPELDKVDTFDFIIVGGGTAGSVVANRLSEYYTVLVLEAGGEPNPLVYVPGLSSHLVNRPEVDWMHKTVAQKRSSTLAQFQRSSWSAGKGMGGSGNLDFMMHLRGSPMDFDNWARLVKDPSWGYELLRPYFQRHENFLGNTTDPQAHAEGGELTLQLPDFRPLATEFVWAGKELGYPNVDLNGRFTEGFDEIYYPIKRGEKQTTYKAFVEPIKKRQNLTIRRFATVTKLLLRKNDNGAYGLEFERHGKKYTVYANREIVVSAGAIQSPKLLLLSGIGPKRHLEDVGVKPVVNLPVGRNLQDHLGVYVGPFFIKEPLSFLFDRDVTAKSFFEYGTYGQGPLTTTGFQAAGMIASSFAKRRGEKNWPDLQLLLHGVSVHANYATDMAHAYGVKEDILKKYYKHAAGRHSFHIVVGLGRPYARGEIRLASRNPTSPPIIDPKYLEDPWDFDIKTMVEGVKKAVEIVEGTTKFQNLGGQFTHEVLPGCENTKFKSDEYWDCYVRQFTVSLHNPVGTCTMGPLDSPHAVVDSELRVVGTNNLRVVDASVMPSIITGGTQATTIAIAEKGAEAILDYWKKKKPQSHVKYDNSEIVTTPKPVVTSPKLPPPTSAPTKAPTSQNYPHEVKTNHLSEGTTNQNQNWQNTLDSIAAFSKSIQQTFQIPQASPPTTTIAAPTPIPTRTTTQITYKAPKPKPIRPTAIQSTLFRTTTAHVIKSSPIPTTRRPLPPMIPSVETVEVPFEVLPTQQSFTTSQPATTYRPTGFNRSAAFSLNIPIIKATYKPVQFKPMPQHPNPVKVYNSAPNKIIQNIVRKEQVYQHKPQHIFIQTTIPTTTTSIPNTEIPTTYRPTQFIHTRQQVFPGYENLVDIPITSVEYLRPDGNQIYPTQAATSSPADIIPAVTLRNPFLETTTQLIPVQHFAEQSQSHQHQHIFLAGLEPFQLQEISTPTALPLPTTSVIPPTMQQPLQHLIEQSSEAPEEQSPIYYVVRKKNNHQDQHRERERPNNQMQMRRPDIRPPRQFLRKPQRNGRRPQRPPPPPPSHMMHSQAQRHMPVLALPPHRYSNHNNNHHHHHNHHMHMEDHRDDHFHRESLTALGSEQMHSVVPREEYEEESVITPAISSPLFQQNVLNQLIPIQ